MPSGGIVADSIGIELLNYGYDIIDTATITSQMTRVNMTEINILNLQNLKNSMQKVLIHHDCKNCFRI